MLLAVWISLGVSLVVLVASAVFAGTRGLAAWRVQRHLRRRLIAGMADVTRRVDDIEERLTAAGHTADELQRAQAHLQESLAAARVLLAAFAEVQATVGRFTGLVPSK